MTRTPRHFLISTMALTVTATLGVGTHAAIVNHPQAEAQALDLAEKAIALRSVRGPWFHTDDAFEALRRQYFPH